ncbi:hypothetical protein [Pseudomonas kilonensis]
MSLAEHVLVSSKVLRGSVFTGTLLVSSLTFVVALTEFYDSKKQSSYLETLFNNPGKIDPLREFDLEKFNAQLSAVKNELESMKGTAITSPEHIDVVRVEAKIDSITNRLELLEGAISNNPEKALSVPMLRKDHEALVKQLNDSLVASKLDYDRLWSMLMLLLTSLGGAVVILSGWALKSIFSKTETQSLERP